MVRGMNVKKYHADKQPPYGAKPAGTTDDGTRQLFRLTRKRSKSKPRYREDGKRAWRVNRITGDEVVPLRDIVIYEEHLLFFMESEGNFNVRMVQYTPLTEEEKRNRERKLEAEREAPALIAALLESGLTAESIKRWVRGEQKGAEPEPEPAPEEEVSPEPVAEEDTKPEPVAEEEPRDPREYPKMFAPGTWYLSAEHERAVTEGEAKGYRGNRSDALAVIEASKQDIEKARGEAKRAAKETPSF